MRLLVLLFAALSITSAQTPGTINVTQNVTATAGTLSCTFSNPARPTIHVSCTGGGSTYAADVTPAVGSTNGYVGSLNAAPNAITWAIQQPTAGTIGNILSDY